MKLSFGICGLALVSAAVAAPQKIKHATQAQIEAVLPTSLRVKDIPNPEGEKRFARLVALANKKWFPEMKQGLESKATRAEIALAARLAQPTLKELDWILIAGPLWKGSKPDPMDSFPDEAAIRMLGRLVALATRDAAERKDQAMCMLCASLGLRLGQGLISAGGDATQLITAEGVESIAERAVLDADGKGGLSEIGRRNVLLLLAPISGPVPESAMAMRREFRERRLPILVDPIHGWEKVYASSMEFAEAIVPKKKLQPSAGNYDPIATARLVGRIFDAAIEDTKRPFGTQTDLARKLVEKAGHAFPASEGIKEAQAIRMLNSMPNSIGLSIACLPVFDGLPEAGAGWAARRNLTRAVLLLRLGETVDLADPYGGRLKVDPKRRIVWSVGKNRKDDGGKIERNASGASLDFGYRY
jgi:hypothetical protein